MKTSINRKVYLAASVVGIICLIALAVQAILTHFGETAWLLEEIDFSETTNIIIVMLMAVPTVIFLVYIILRLYEEMKSIWRTILAAIGYPLVCICICFLEISGRIVNAFLILGILIPIVFSLLGLCRKTGWMTLISSMIFNAYYAIYTAALIVMAGSLGVYLRVGGYFPIPLILFVASDLAVQYRLAATRETQPNSIA